MRKGFTLIELLIVIAIIAILALIAIPNFIEAQTRSKVSRAMADMRSLGTAIESYFVDYNSYPLVVVPDNNNPCDGDMLYCRFTYSAYLWQVCGAPYSSNPQGVRSLTTPIAYFAATLPLDPFNTTREYSEFPMGQGCSAYSYHFMNFLGTARAWAKDGGATWNSVNDDGSGNNALDPQPPYPPIMAPAPIRFNNGFLPAPTNWESKPVRYANWALMSVGPDRHIYSQPGEFNISRSTLMNRTTKGWQCMASGRYVTYDPTNGTVSRGDIWRLSGGANP